MITNPVTHHIRFDQRVGGWVVIAHLPTGRTVVSRPRKPNPADDKRMEFNKATATGRIPLYESVPKHLEIPDNFP